MLDCSDLAGDHRCIFADFQKVGNPHLTVQDLIFQSRGRRVCRASFEELVYLTDTGLHECLWLCVIVYGWAISHVHVWLCMRFICAILCRNIVWTIFVFPRPSSLPCTYNILFSPYCVTCPRIEGKHLIANGLFLITLSSSSSTRREREWIPSAFLNYLDVVYHHRYLKEILSFHIF